MRALVFAAAATVLTTACTTGLGMVTGAIPGANPGIVVGSPVGSGGDGPPLGVMEAGLTGADIGRSLTPEDRRMALQAEYEALEYARPGQPTEWQNGASGNFGSIVVGASSEVNRLNCREYTHTVYIGGRARPVSGTACRLPDGVWRVVG